MAKPLVIGLDLGTTTVKAMAMDAQAKVAASVGRRVNLQAPRPGWATQLPRDYTQAVMRTLAELAGRIDGKQVAGIAVSGAMHSIIPIGRDDRPMAAGMTWADRRGSEQVEALRREVDTKAMHRRTGCPVRWLYHPARLRWWRGYGEVDTANVSRFVSMKEWVIHALSGRWACDRGLASTTGLLNLGDGQWDAEALEAAGIEADQLCALVDAQAIVGRLNDDIAELTGLPGGVPIIAGSTDGALANLGAAGGEAGRIVITVGTSGAVRRTVDSPSVDDEEQSWCYLIADGLYVRGGAINSGGMAAEWIVEQCYGDLAPERRFDTMLREAAEVGPGADGVVMLPYLAGERTPLWEPGATASIHGMARRHGRAHLARAALESVAFCLRDVWGVIAAREAAGEGACLTGGITGSAMWCRIVAEVLGTAIEPCKAVDGSAIGAARLGHWALGHVDGLGAFGPLPCHERIEPEARQQAAYEQAYQRFVEYRTARRAE